MKKSRSLNLLSLRILWKFGIDTANSVRVLGLCGRPISRYYETDSPRAHNDGQFSRFVLRRLLKTWRQLPSPTQQGCRERLRLRDTRGAATGLCAGEKVRWYKGDRPPDQVGSQCGENRWRVAVVAVETAKNEMRYGKKEQHRYHQFGVPPRYRNGFELRRSACVCQVPRSCSRCPLVRRSSCRRPVTRKLKTAPTRNSPPHTR